MLSLTRSERRLAYDRNSDRFPMITFQDIASTAGSTIRPYLLGWPTGPPYRCHGGVRFLARQLLALTSEVRGVLCPGTRGVNQKTTRSRRRVTLGRPCQSARLHSARRARDCWTGLHVRLGHFSWLVRGVFCVVNLGELGSAPAASDGKHAEIYQSRQRPEGGTETVPVKHRGEIGSVYVALDSKTPHQRRGTIPPVKSNKTLAKARGCRLSTVYNLDGASEPMLHCGVRISL